MDIGTIKKDWYEGALQNGTHTEIESWFSEMINGLCEIETRDCDYRLTVWHRRSTTNQDGSYYLSQERIDDICARIDER